MQHVMTLRHLAAKVLAEQVGDIPSSSTAKMLTLMPLSPPPDVDVAAAGP